MEIKRQGYQVKLGIFEGPLEVLLGLIEERKLEIAQVSLAEVTDQFIKYVETTRIEGGMLAEFLQVAATLLIIKTKALLPFLTFSAEEEQEVVDLETRLKVLAAFREAGRRLRKAIRQKRFSCGREMLETFTVTFYPPKNIDAEMLHAGFRNTAEAFAKFFEKQTYAGATMRKVVSLEEKIRHLTEMIESALEKRFHEVIRNSKDKMEVIVTFLAMLELIKQRLVSVEQQGLFGEITIKKLRE